MPRPKKLSKTKQLRHELLRAAAEHQVRYNALNRLHSAQMAETRHLLDRLNAYGGTQVDYNYTKQLYSVSMFVDLHRVSLLRNPGEFLADIARKLCIKLVRERPEFSGTLPRNFFTQIRNLPANERRAHLIPLYDRLRQTIYEAYSSADAKDNADTQELYEVFSRSLTFPSFCHLLTLLEKHASCLPLGAAAHNS